MKVSRVEIQRYSSNPIKHYRARIEGELDWRLETQPNETLDMFRARIMYSLNTGCIFLFQHDVELI